MLPDFGNSSILTTVLKKMLSKFTFYRKKRQQIPIHSSISIQLRRISLILLPKIGLPGFFANIAPLSSAFSGPFSSPSSSASFNTPPSPSTHPPTLHPAPPPVLYPATLPVLHPAKPHRDRDTAQMRAAYGCWRRWNRQRP